MIFRRRKSRDETRNGTRHVAIVVENVALGVDTRLRKQVHDLLANGHRVSVVTMRSADNVGYRTTSNLRVLEYPPPPEVTGSIGYVVEYLVSLAWAVALLSRLRLRGRIDVLQVCQPPDVYFPLCWLLRWSGTRVVIDQRDLMPELFAARYDDPSRAMLGILRWLERRTQRVADHTLCVNEYLRDRLVDAGAEPATISIVRNGPVLARVEKVSADPTLKESQRFLICWILSGVNFNGLPLGTGLLTVASDNALRAELCIVNPRAPRRTAPICSTAASESALSASAASI